MNGRGLLTLSLAWVFVLFGTARAETHDGFYLGAYVGMPVTNTLTVEDEYGRFNLTSDPGRFLAVSCGFDLPRASMLGDGRIEVEYAQRSNSFKRVKFSDAQADAAGELGVQSLLLNTFAVFRNDTLLTPYLGVGFGGVRLQIDNLNIKTVPTINDSALVLAGQGGVGLDIDLGSAFRLDVGYRYIVTDQAEFHDAAGRKIQLDYAAHTALVGVIYKF